MGLVIGTGGLHIGTSGGGASPVKRFDAEAEYIKRKAGGSDEIGTGKAKIPTLKGKSVVWNQLVQNGDFENNTSGWSIAKGTATVTSGVCEITKAGAAYMYQSIPAKIVGHKYFISFSASASVSMSISVYWGDTFVPNISITTSMSKYAYVATAGNGNTNLNFSTLTSSTGDVLRISNIKLIDLTLMFGAGNEPSTVEEFEAMYPLPYYDHNSGQIINNAAEAIETVGFNQWDEEWENGTFNTDTGVNINNGGALNQIRCKNLIRVIPNAAYNIKRFNRTEADFMWGMFYGSDMNIITDPSITDVGASQKYQSSFKFVSGAKMIVPANAAYFKFYLTGTYPSTYQNDICINLFDTSKNGQYKPYEKHTLQLGLGSFDVKDSEDNVITVNGLKSAGSVFDEIDLARGKYIKRIGSVDLGSLEWNYESSKSAFYNQTNIKARGFQNIICSKYPTRINTDGDNWALSDKEIGGGVNSERIYVKDSAYSDTATFKVAMSGVYAYYELATPEEYDLVNPIGNSYKVISGGTEERLPRDTASSVIAPIKYSVKYVQPKD